MNRFLLRWVGNALGLYIAAQIIPGIDIGSNPLTVLGVALVFGLVNALIRPVLSLLTCPLIALTLGLFTLVINAVLLLLTAALSRAVGLTFVVEGFWPALLGALVISVVSLIMTLFLHDDRK